MQMLSLAAESVGPDHSACGDTVSVVDPLMQQILWKFNPDTGNTWNNQMGKLIIGWVTELNTRETNVHSQKHLIILTGKWLLNSWDSRVKKAAVNQRSYGMGSQQLLLQYYQYYVTFML